VEGTRKRVGALESHRRNIVLANTRPAMRRGYWLADWDRAKSELEGMLAAQLLAAKTRGNGLVDPEERKSECSVRFYTPSVLSGPRAG
jgi:hypothetical protein